MGVPKDYVYCEYMTVEGVCYSHADHHEWVDGGAYHHRDARAPVVARIAASAIRQDEVVYTGAHHHQIIRYMAPMLGIPTVTGEQGFITNGNNFVGREEAMRIALSASQVTAGKTHHARDLFSEDLWSVPDWVFVPGSEKHKVIAGIYCHYKP